MRLFPPRGKSRQVPAVVSQSLLPAAKAFPGIKAAGHNCKNPFMLLAFTPSAKTARPPSAGERRNESTTCAPAPRLHRKTAYASREREPAKEG